MRSLLVLLCIFLHMESTAQSGTITGIITDKITEKPIEGATVSLSDRTKNAISGKDGSFRITSVPVGRQTILVSYVGYESTSIPNLDVTTGKDLFLTIGIAESFNKLETVVVKASSGKDVAINKLAAVSARQFSVEEVSRYSGGRSDVARLVANFAGVSAPDDSRNDIVIRGNSPVGLQWRIEGIPIPSPNHFSTLGTTGSPVSALNPHVLKNSDFITSAFPAEYGNAIGGIFDLGFKSGNKAKHEYTVGVGAYTGLEAMAEGPMGKRNGSYVIAGRYSIAQFLGSSGGTTAPPIYTDLSLNINFGKSKLGDFSLFGIGGYAEIDLIGKDAREDDLFAFKDEDGFPKSGFSVIGLKHTIPVGANSYIKTTVGGSYSFNTIDNFRYFDYQTPRENKLTNIDIENNTRRFSVSSFFNSRISSQFNIRTGLLLENYRLNATLLTREQQPDDDGDGYPDFNNIIDNKGSFTILQPYAQGQYRLTPSLTFSAGIHTQYFSLNDQLVAEPRGSLSWAFNAKNTISFGYGLHHQNVAEPLLFLNEDVNGELVQTNKELKLVRSNHYVAGYDTRLGDKWRGKLEVYYQQIDKAAIENTISGYSSLTEGAEFIFSTDKSSLVSKGTGFNRGVELTLEKFYSRGYHLLFTSSVFESKYKGSDGVERNSPFNNRFVVNVLGGKEFRTGKVKKNVFSIDTKITTSGGRHFTPIDLLASNTAGYEVKQVGQEYNEQYKNYFRMDLKFSMKLNHRSKKTFHQFYIDLQNITDNDNTFRNQYNRLTGRIDVLSQIGFAPDFGYRYQF
ncbi:MAG: TonB-dependent receptor [Chitinophagaceae bacterium]|nr:TonB-dependent receptor [Chitinophagaceae bacterium]